MRQKEWVAVELVFRDRAVVISHHAPSPRSIQDWYEGDPFNCAFASNLGPVIERYQPECKRRCKSRPR